MTLDVFSGGKIWTWTGTWVLFWEDFFFSVMVFWLDSILNTFCWGGRFGILKRRRLVFYPGAGVGILSVLGMRKPLNCDHCENSRSLRKTPLKDTVNWLFEPDFFFGILWKGRASQCESYVSSYFCTFIYLHTHNLYQYLQFGFPDQKLVSAFS